MKTSSPLVFFGSDEFSADVLSALLQHDFFADDLKYVVTKTPQKKGRGQTLTPTAVHKIADTLPKVRILHANTKRELDSVMAELPAPLRGVLVSYGVIVSSFVLDRFTPGVINFHPSLLPAYRGPSPIESAIMNGEETTGVSVMKLEPKMDAGPVYAQYRINLAGNETAADLYKRIAHDASDWFADQLQAIWDGSLTPRQQDDSAATYTHIIQKQDGQLDPHTLTAAECEQRIRAYQPFPKVHMDIDDIDMIIIRAHVDQTKSTPLSIECADDMFLTVDELIAPSGKKMSATAYLNGRRS